MNKMTVNEYFTGKEEQVADKHMKSYPTSFVHRNRHPEIKGLVRFIQTKSTQRD